MSSELCIYIVYRHILKIHIFDTFSLPYIHVIAVVALVKENGSGCLDTVGAVVVDLEGNVAAAVSSGGLAMKHPGRVGQVGLPLFI